MEILGESYEDIPLDRSGKWIAVLGGTFNPVHNGHIAAATYAARQFGARQALLIPTNLPPHKTAAGLAPGRDRLEMCEIACRETNPPDIRFTASDMELSRGQVSYTADTLRELEERYGSGRFLWIVGGDMLVTLPTWYAYEEILRRAVICGLPRGRADYEALRPYAARIRRDGGRVYLAPMSPVAISSTGVRRRAAQGKPLTGLVPQGVEDYIKIHHLYRDGAIC